jgi:hypothetical protein
MFKSLVALTILGAMSASAVAQNAPATDPAKPAKPQTVKKRVCEMIDEDSYSRLGNRKICKTVEVPVEQQGGAANGQQTPAPANSSTNNNM